MSESGSAPVRVHVYYDFSCPFSYVADARLTRLRAELPAIRVAWRPLEIRPEVPRDGLRAARPGEEGPEGWRESVTRARELAEEEQLPFREPDLVPNTHEALQAGEFAKDLSGAAFRRLRRSLFRAYFREGRDLGDREVLLAAAEEAGADPEALRLALEDGRYEVELREAEREAERYGVTGTPTLLFGRFKVVGAAPPDVLREAAGRAAREG